MSMLMAGLMLAQTPAMALAAEMTQEIVDEAELILEEEAGAEETASVEAAATETLSVEGIEEVASAATPVPGGVGSVTTAVLAKHLVRAAGL